MLPAFPSTSCRVFSDVIQNEAYIAVAYSVIVTAYWHYVTHSLFFLNMIFFGGFCTIIESDSAFKMVLVVDRKRRSHVVRKMEVIRSCED